MKTQTKHSPGPWHWSDAYPNALGERTWSLVAGGGFGVLSCDLPNSPQMANPANAALLAAAPDLLRALEDLLTLEERLEHVQPADMKGRVAADVRIAARAAIAKAQAA